ncbi:MAG: hypothetical protein GF390_01740 [Candidatus Pacebacteria bacterium]|nr:hypothetical protein [Candidatus Paceibacterota bacterium]
MKNKHLILFLLGALIAGLIFLFSYRKISQKQQANQSETNQASQTDQAAPPMQLPNDLDTLEQELNDTEIIEEDLSEL